MRDRQAFPARPNARLATAAWAALLVLALAAIAWQSLRGPVGAPHADEHTAAQRLFATDPASWTALEVFGPDGRHRFERDDAGRWFRHAAVAGEAADHSHASDATEAARIAEVLATFSRCRVERTLPAHAARGADYGLDRPQHIILVEGAGGRMIANLEVGAMAADALSRYVRDAVTDRALLVAHYQIEGVLGLLAPRSAIPPATNELPPKAS